MNDYIQIGIESMKLKNTFRKYFTMLEMVEMKESIMAADAECKVYCESGSSDDLDYLYTEAKNATSASKKNIFNKIFNTIHDVVHKILDKISDIFGIKTTDKNAKVEVPKEFADKGLLQKIKDVMKKILSAGTNIKNLLFVPGELLLVYTLYNKQMSAYTQAYDNISIGDALDMTEDLEVVVNDINNITDIFEDIVDEHADDPIEDSSKAEKGQTVDDDSRSIVPKTPSEPMRTITNTSVGRMPSPLDAAKNDDRSDTEKKIQKLKELIASKTSAYNRYKSEYGRKYKAKQMAEANKAKANRDKTAKEIKDLETELAELEKSSTSVKTESVTDSVKKGFKTVGQIAKAVMSKLSSILSYVMKWVSSLYKAINSKHSK